MVNVGEVRVAVCERAVAVPMGVGFARRLLARVGVVVVLVVDMRMIVVQLAVLMLVNVSLRQVEPDARSHQKSGDDGLRR